MVKHCSYALCKSDSRYHHTEAMEGVTFWRIPDPTLKLGKCQRWVHACGRKNFSWQNITRYHYICSKHFVGGHGPTATHPDPIPWNQAAKKLVPRIPVTERIASRKNTQSRTKILRADEDNNSMANNDDENNDSMANNDDENNDSMASNNESQAEESNCLGPEERHRDFEVQVQPPSEETGCQVQAESTECGVQTLSHNYARQLFARIETSRSIPPKTHAPEALFASYHTAKLDPTMFKYFTGLTVKKFDVLYYHFLKECNMDSLKYSAEDGTPEKVNSITSKLSNLDKLYITLMRMKRGFTLQEIAFFVHLNISTVSTIIYTWTQFLYFEFLSLKRVMFQSRESQRKMKPACFRRFKNLRVIIDCTEIFIQMPQNFEEQGNTFSNYKHTNTVKFLVGMSVNKAIIFISEGFEGSISDREIFIKSGIMDFLVPGDEVMSDRGFDVQDLLDPMKVKLIIPPYLSGRDSFTPEEELLTKLIARSRSHVERAIGSIKDFKILQPYVPYTLLPVISNIFYVAACLSNFEPIHLI